MALTQSDIERYDSTDAAWHFITGNYNLTSDERRLVNEWYDDYSLNDTEYSDTIKRMLEENADDLTLVEHWKSDYTDETEVFIHYFNRDEEEIRMYDPRSGGDMDPNPWVGHAVRSGEDLCFATREEAFGYHDVDAPDETQTYTSGRGVGNDVTMTIEGSDDGIKNPIGRLQSEVENELEQASGRFDSVFNGNVHEFSFTVAPEEESAFYEMMGVDNRDEALEQLGVATEEETAADVLRETADTVEDKHGDYGHAIETTAALKGVLANEGKPEVVELDDGREAVVMGEHTEENAEQRRMGGIITRLLDKVSRGYTLTFTDREDNVGEKKRETWSDAAGYCGHAATDQ